MVDTDKIVKNYRLFIDTCSLLHDKAENFFYHALPPILLRHKKKIIIPEKVMKEVERLQNHQKAATRDIAKKGSKILKSYIDQNLVDIRGDTGDPFADGVFQYVFMKFRIRHNLALLTQDTDLAHDIMHIQDSKAVKSKKNIITIKLNTQGELVYWNSFSKQYSTNNRCTQPNIIHKFRECKQPIATDPQKISVKNLPVVGDIVHSENYGKLTLLDTIGEGGEGRIFRTSTNDIACKVYSHEKLTDLKLQKIDLMLKNPVKYKGICWPIDIVSNQDDQSIGYLMPLAKGIPMHKGMFIKHLLKKNYPNWTRKSLVNLALAILDKIQHLHNRNILLGDINPLNIIIESEYDIFFVDTDSCQIEGFPCPVGMINYTAPELQGLNFETFLRKPEHEYFAVATLLFMILLPGKLPFSHQGGGNPSENIKHKLFPYPLGEKTTKKTPEGPWRFIWSNLPYRTKEAFYQCFAEGTRHDTAYWIDIVKAYQSDLSKGWVSNELFPTTFKQVSDHAKKTYGVEDGFTAILCSKCGQKFTLQNKDLNSIKNPRVLCPKCFQLIRNKQTKEKMLICSTCGRQFLFSISEQKFYDNKGLLQPKSCPACRLTAQKTSKKYTSSKGKYAQFESIFITNAIGYCQQLKRKIPLKYKVSIIISFIVTVFCFISGYSIIGYISLINAVPVLGLLTSFITMIYLTIKKHLIIGFLSSIVGLISISSISRDFFK